MFRPILASLICGLLLVIWPLTSAAHAKLEKSIPENNSELTAAPQTVQLWFSGNVQAEWSTIEVTDSNGKRIDKETVTGNDSDPKYLQVELNSPPTGTYRVKWSTLSRDGHRIKGEYSFMVK